MKKTVVELFAGVGGFRLGLEENGWETIWANQWEPSTKMQHAYDVYIANFGEENTSNEDINNVNYEHDIPKHTLLVGGFPCQDYSVARTKAEGIVGKKGVLWWSIYDILKLKKPPFALLENVDRLIKSPAKQKGRDFGVMLRTVYDLGYSLEWRVINAADYGFVQRRRRVFLFLAHKSTHYYKSLRFNQANAIIDNKGFFSHEFPTDTTKESKKPSIKKDITQSIYSDLVSVSDNFEAKFLNSGFMKNGKIFSKEIIPKRKEPMMLKDVLESNVSDKYYLNSSAKLEKIKRMKGAKSESRVSSTGYKYNYSEGRMSFPDRLDKPARTVLTSETSINRSTHVIEDPETQGYRLLTPLEVERLNGFPDNWTKPENLSYDITEKRRYFFMGNALVVDLVKKIGIELNRIIKDENKH